MAAQYENKNKAKSVSDAARARSAEAKAKADAAKVEGIVKSPVTDLHWPGTLCVCFFDASNATAIELDSGTNVQVRYPGIKEWSNVKLSAQLNNRGCQDVMIDLNGLEDKLENEQEVAAELRIENGSYQSGCRTYTSGVVMTTLRKLARRETAEDCCCISFPMVPISGSSTINFLALDVEKEQNLRESDEGFKEKVEWTVTAVRTPAPSQAKSESTNSGTEQSDAFQPWSRSVTSDDEGRAVIYGAPLHQLYVVETRAGGNLVPCESSTQYLQICCDPQVSVTSCFRRCAQRPGKWILFLDGKCKAPWGNEQQLQLGTTLIGPIDANGFAEVPAGMQGRQAISSPGFAFSPHTVELNEEEEVMTVLVYQESAAEVARSGGQRFYLLDENQRPYPGRTVQVKALSGAVRTVKTEADGGFYAENGAVAWAPEDEQGYEIEAFTLWTSEVS
jgi:hypothetical protein